MKVIANFGAEERDFAPIASVALERLAALLVAAVRESPFKDREVVRWLEDTPATRAFSDKARALTFADDVLSRAAIVVEDVPRALPTLPAWAIDWTLKPRFGSSGRGRTRVTSLLDVERAWPRLKARGGAILEPWVTRTEDRSAAGWVHEGGRVDVLAHCVLEVTGAGLPRGVTSAEVHPVVDEQARAVGRALAAAGHIGPFGIDAFGYSAGFRCPVEVNPRWTLGVVGALLNREQDHWSFSAF